MPGASRSIVINAPAEKVFDIVSGYEKYPEFMSEVREVKTSNRKGNQVDVHYKVDLIKTIKNLMAVSGGVGTIVGFVHDWANPENTRRSWDMVARYVVPEINGYLTKLRESRQFLVDNRAVFERAGQAVMAKIMQIELAAAALPLTGPGRIAIPTVNAPDLQKEAAKRKA